MRATAYEEALVGRRPSKPKLTPSVIEVAKNSLGRENFASEINGTYRVWEGGRWLGPLNLDGLIQAANRKRVRQGLSQLTGNPAWRV